MARRLPLAVRMPRFPSCSSSHDARGLCAAALVVGCTLSSARIAFAQEAATPTDSAPAPATTESSTSTSTAPPPGEPASGTPPAPTSEPETAQPAEAPPPAAPYSLPWQLRPAAATTTVRLDTAFAFYEDPVSHHSGFTTVPMASFSYKVVTGFAPMVRIGLVQNSPPDATAPAANPPSGFGFLNPVVGGTYALELSKELRLAFFLGLTIPVGLGGGDNPDRGNKLARTVGIPARSAMDNAMFAVNDFTVFPGVDFAFVSGGFTAQAEATLFQLTRVRGSADQKDSSRTNLTMGLHVGYFVIPAISLGAEIRHQRWVSTPSTVTTPSLRDTTTVAVGPRFHFQGSKGKWFRPGLAFAFPLDDPMKKSSYKIVQLDLPFSF